ncbi:hypothetical protein ACFLZN_02800 [Nanoarchaeota archaeon]
MADFIIIPAIICGFVLGLYEAISLIKDVEIPLHRFSHATHAFATSFIFTFAVFNVPFVVSLLPFLKIIPVIGIQVILGLIAAIKVHATSKVTKSTAGLQGGSETWFHTFIVGGLIIAAPYVWPFIAKVLPVWMR